MGVRNEVEEFKCAEILSKVCIHDMETNRILRNEIPR
jgi:hypothetical protein